LTLFRHLQGMTAGTMIDVKGARRLLGVGPGVDATALTAAFREAALRTHPDRDGGDARAFREVLEAYRLLREAPPEPIAFIPAPAAAPRARELEVSPAVALNGGEAFVETLDGRRLKLKLEAGLRSGQQVRAGGELFTVAIRGAGATVRGDDIWVTADVASEVLTDGGRVTVETPVGPRTLWISRKAADRKLVRLPGEGLPATATRRRGDLFVRLAAGPDRAESAAKVLLRRFAAAWAA
jgi:curved DNA-binding protein